VSLASTVLTWGRMVKFSHSVFALPFAFLATVLAAAIAGGPAGIDGARLAGQATLVLVAMVAARTWAMLANRIADRAIDARNPRTAGRALASGAVPARTAVLVAAAAAAVFALAAAGFLVLFGNPWPIALAVPVLAWIGAYPFFKRFSALCHVWLGASLALSPLAAALAVHPPAALAPPVWLLSGMVLFWVAGFDVFYAMQNVETDRRDGLHSLPARLGVARALRLARGMHLVTAGLLVACWFVEPRFGTLFAVAVAAAATLLAWEHAIVARHGTGRITLAFFTLNGVVSCVVGGLGVLDVLV